MMNSPFSRYHYLSRSAPTRAAWILACTILFGQFLVAGPVARADASRPPDQVVGRSISLPTPPSHYETFKPGTSGVPLLLALIKELDPESQKALLSFAASSGLLGRGSAGDLASPELATLLEMARTAGFSQATMIPKAQALALLERVDWTRWRPMLLEFMVHQSHVLDMIPAEWGPIWQPVVHDALLYFLDSLPQDRLLEKVVDLAYLPPDSPRGAYLTAFVAKTPSLQKLGQILARNPDISPDYRTALQQLENGIHTMTRDELVQFITDDVGKANIDKYHVEFADEILAEASVGAVIRATCTAPGSKVKEEAVCKVVKPYVLVNLPQELEIIDGLAMYFNTEHDYYKLGTIPLVEMFKDIKKALEDEIQIVDEQHNLVRAGQYYRNNKNVVVPRLYPISTGHVTFMQYIAGEKITSAFEGQPEQRAIMARRFYDVMTYGVIFSGSEDAIFHGDPHAGNVYHVTGNPKNPYQIALLDWGLCGTFPREDRMALVQLILGVELRDRERLHEFVGYLLEDGLPTDPAKLKRIDAIVESAVEPKPGRTSFEALEDLLVGLVDEGYATKFSLNLFIKSQVTIAGILHELDPTLDQDAYLTKRVTSLVKREIPKRLLCTIWFPAWRFRGFRSLLSDADLMVARRLRAKPKEATNAKVSTKSIPTPIGAR